MPGTLTGWTAKVALALGVSLAAPATSWACGAIFEPIEAQSGAAFEAQTVLIHRRADRVDLHVRMTISPGGDVSWVLPSAPGATLSLGDDALFDALDEVTRPTIELEYVGSTGGCSPPSDGAAAPPDGVDVQAVGRIGEYDYAIIASGDAAAAAAWLTENGFAVPDGAEAAMQPYADLGMEFIGVRLARPADDPDGSTRPTPLILSVADDSAALPAYPLGLSALSVDRVLPVLVYVLGERRARVGGVTELTVVDVADRILEQRYLEYAEAVDRLSGENTGAVWITDAVLLDSATAHPWLADLGGGVLTRLSARLPVEDIADAMLEWHPEGRAAVDPYQYRSYGTRDEGCVAADSSSPAMWAFAVLFGLARRRRRARR